MPKKSRKKKRPRKAAPPRPASRKTTRPAAGPKSPPNLWQRVRRNWAATALVILGVLVVGSMIIGLVAPSIMSPPPPTPAEAVKQYDAPPPMIIDPTEAYTATVETTKGTIVIQLLPEVAPQTVNSFVFLARNGFYDGLTFHRVEDWVVQGGDPLGTGAGGPGYTVPAEFESSTTYSQVRGIVGLARSQDPNSGSCQWYITKKDSTFLDSQYTTFGRVVKGMDVVDKLTIGDVMTRVTIAESE
jgi:cyclophilin family peptidyl-prolyl cis-trans isomerase